MNIIEKSIEEIFALFAAGGAVMWPLTICLLIMWFCLGYRFFSLRRGSHKTMQELISGYRDGKRKYANGIVDTAVKNCVALSKSGHENWRLFVSDILIEFRDQIGVFSKTINAVVLAAPLLGLLGTVTGMIELFDSLSDQAFFSQTGGIAGGISEALITTQMGLCIAIPGVLAQRYLTRKEQVIQDELDQLQVAIGVNEIEGK